MSAAPRFVGVWPRCPGRLGRWLADAIPAERMAALRIAASVALLFDILSGCVPQFSTLFTADGLAGRDAHPWRFRTGAGYWSLLRWLPDAWGPHALLCVWITAAFALLLGWRPFVSGLTCWACAVSFQGINPWVCNGGDQLRNALLLGVAVSRGGAVWGVRSERAKDEPVFVPGWPAKVLLVQFACAYFFSGVYKLMSPTWRSGEAMFFVTRDQAWSLVPGVTGSVPEGVGRFAAWGTIGWELAFPLLIAFGRTRAACLWVGVAFHVLTLVTLEIGHFALYALAWYVLFVPWERRRGPVTE